MLKTLRRQKAKTNPVIYSELARSLLAHDPERLNRLFEDTDSVDLLTWNVFASMDTDHERDYLASLLRPLVGNDMRAPLRISLWTGRHRQPHLRPSPAYVRHVRERVGDADADLETFTAPIEVPVRIEAPGLLALVDTTIESMPQGAGGRDRLVELVDAGLQQARNVGKDLVISVVYRSGTETAAALSRRINRLRRHDELASALPWRSDIPEVRFRELSWQQLLKVWENERNHFKLSREPVRDFLDYAGALGLR